MKHKEYWKSSVKLSSEKDRLHALQVYVTRSIAHQYGGTVQPDPITKTINVTVPGIEGDECAEEIAKQVGAMSHYISTQIEALEGREILIRIMPN